MSLCVEYSTKVKRLFTFRAKTTRLNLECAGTLYLDFPSQKAVQLSLHVTVALVRVTGVGIPLVATLELLLSRKRKWKSDNLRLTESCQQGLQQ